MINYNIILLINKKNIKFYINKKMGCDGNNCETKEDAKNKPENKQEFDKEESINMDQDPFLKQSCAPTVIIPKKK
jgi:hypothetical protein